MPTGIYKRSEKEAERMRKLSRKVGFKKGVKFKVWNKGTHKSGMLGKKHSPDTRQKMRETQKRKWDKIGRKSSWNELIRKSAAFKQWRRSVFVRDDWTCRGCGARSEKGQRVILHPHHIKQLAHYPELAFEVGNGVTLCIDCHQAIHKSLKLSVRK